MMSRFPTSRRVGRWAAHHGAVTLLQDLRRYLSVLGALLRQEEDLRRRAPFGAILMLLEPIVLIGTLMTLRALFERTATIASGSPLGGSLILFYATGFYIKYLFIYISMRQMRTAGGAPRSRFPIEQRLDGFAIHVLLRLIEWLVLGVLVFGTMYSFGIMGSIPYDFEICLKALAAIAALGFGWGVFNLVMSRFITYWNVISMAFNRALIILSGVLFIPDFLPPSTRYWVDFNPEMHAIAYFRSAFYPHYPKVLLDTTYLTYCAIVAVFLGLALERVTRRFER